MVTHARLQTNGMIFDVVDHPEDEKIVLTVSRERWEDDHVQFPLPRHVARALGLLLAGEKTP